MANLPESPNFDAGVFQIETTTPALGGVDGPANLQGKNLANRTAYLKQRIDLLESGSTIPPTMAPKNSPALTGTPTAPTPPLDDDSLKIANTSFVKDLCGMVLSKNVSGGANVVLTALEASAPIIVLTGVITANIAILLPVIEGKWIVRNNTTGAYTVTVRRVAGGSGVVIPQNASRHVWSDDAEIRYADSSQIGSVYSVSSSGVNAHTLNAVIPSAGVWSITAHYRTFLVALPGPDMNLRIDGTIVDTAFAYGDITGASEGTMVGLLQKTTTADAQVVQIVADQKTSSEVTGARRMLVIATRIG